MNCIHCTDIWGQWWPGHPAMDDSMFCKQHQVETKRMTPQHCIECRYQNTLRTQRVDLDKDVIALPNSLFCERCKPKSTASTYNKRSGWYLPKDDQMHGDYQYALVAKRLFEFYGLSKVNSSTVDGISIFHDSKGNLIKRMVLRNFFVGAGVSVYDIPSENKNETTSN
jgi:hypothetical protein